MSTKWLNIFFRFSGFVFALKQKIVSADSWTKAVPYAVLLMVTELGFVIISLPMYILVPPEKVQEGGKIFPRKERTRPQLHTYVVRRKISLTTILGAGGIFAFKVIFIGIVSFYLLGAQKLLADTQAYTFGTPANYTVSTSTIEFVGGNAQLKDIGSTVFGATTNPGFDTNITGWTYADWGQGGGEANIAGARVTTGGNPGAYVNISAPSGSGDELGGYWRQPFTTTVANPSTTLSFDWEITAFDSTPVPITYKLYAFVDTGSGVPTIGQEVWSSGEITGTSGWASVSNLDVSSKVTTAGTYYLKVAVWLETPGSASGPFTLGYDNIQLNWTKTTHVYDTNKPNVRPNTSLSVPKAISWNGFSETATKNGGEIFYQLSSDNGTSWKYWNGAWSPATSSSTANIATDINTNIPTFTTSTNQILWRAFLSSNGSQQVILSSVTITYTQNQAPVVANLVPAQNTQYGYVYVNYNLQDTESDPSSLTAYEYSLTGAFAGEQVTMTASTTDPNHNGVSGLTASPAGVAHTFVWNAQSQLGNVYNSSVYVRLRPNDGIQNGNYTASSVFTVDYVSSTVSNVSAVETLGTTNVQITYDLFDNTTDNIFVELQISGDGGSTWTVPATSVTGAVGAGVTSGNGKTITWNAGTDYSGQQKSNMQVRVRAKDKWQNQGGYASSANFSLDTLAPATLATANLVAQPNAGDTTVLISGSFTEVNPNTNDFAVAIDGGAYSATTTGDTNTATPSNQATAVGTTLDGNDYITGVKITHTDDYGLSFANQNTSPTVALKYVKPYTPQAPILSSPITTQLNLAINPHASEASDVEYQILETTQNKYVQADGTLGAVAVWQTASVWGTKIVTGLTSPVANYIFKVKSRNPSDTAHTATSESAFSATAQIPNTAPAITLNSYAQTTNGTQYVPIVYTGTDGQGDVTSLSAYQYSTDNSTWNTMTEKAGVGSSGTTNLIFLPTGSAFTFAWDSGTDLANVEDSTVYVRLKGNDTLVDGSLATSAALEIDNKVPVVSAVTAAQNAGARTVAITYTLTDANNSTVAIDISSDGGSTWNVASTTMSGAVGAGVVPGAGKAVTWNAGTDYNNQYNTTMQVRVRARDTFGNVGITVASSNFTLDTKAPVIANTTAVQDSGADTFTFHYDVSEDIGNVAIVLAISSDGGSSWTVPVTSALGDVDAGIVPGTGKTITWNGTTDYNNQEKTAMQIRITATDSFTNNSNLASSNFTLDTKAPRVTNVTAVETLGGTNVTIHYDLADQNNSLVELDISSDNGSSWTVTDTSVTGDVGAGIAAGASKTIIWNAATDFPNQTVANMKVRVRGKDTYNNQSLDTVSSAFALDTLPPATLTQANLIAQPLAGDTTALVGGSFTETNPSTNGFYLAIDTGDYGAATTGTANTATPANQATAAGTTLKGNNYISKVKIIHTDEYGQSVTNENLTPNASYKYVKPYTPSAPTPDNPTVGTVDVLINKNTNEVDGLEYAIYETSQSKFVQSDGTLGASAVWQVLGTGSGQWGNNTGVSGKVKVNGLATHSYLYQFQVKSRNSSDASHAVSSESALSSGASSANQSPVIVLGSIAQTTDGTKYVTINYTGSDLESENVSLVKYQYSTDNSVWHTMTEKAGVGSDGVAALSFIYTGTAHDFMWDVGTDLANTEDNTVYIRLQGNDGTSDGGVVSSGAFTIDTKIPVVSTVTASQTLGSHNVTIGYNLTELSASNVEINISADGGGTWTVPVTSASGDVGAGVGGGSGKAITWNSVTDFSGQEVATMKTQIRATDSFGNQGAFVPSANFALDSKAPVTSNVSAVQNTGNNTFAITYDLADGHNSTVAIDISSDGGGTWTVPVVSVTGDIGAGIVAGVGKTITWDGGNDFFNQEVSNMKVRVRATDTYANAGNNSESGNFSLDTKPPVVTNITALQIVGSNNFTFTYDLFDLTNSRVAVDISSDGGLSWMVASSTLSGAVGNNVVPAVGKTVTWNAGVDYNNHQNNNMKIRVRATDGFDNTSLDTTSAIFTLDTIAPVTLVSADLQSQPNAGDTTALVGGSFTEVNPISNSFLVAINGSAVYSATTTGSANTASPADQATGVGATLTGHDYISKVKIVETDNYGHVGTNENTTPNTAYKYVKPYTPPAPTVNNPQNTAVDVAVNAHASEAGDVQYAIFENSTGKYVQADGTLNTSAVWQLATTWGTKTVSGLTSPVANYSFKVKSRNPSDTAYAVSSESAFSASAAITNTAPSLTINSASQQIVGNYVLVNYTGSDAQNDTNNITAYEYSTDNSNWHAMTEKTGVGSNGITNLVFASAGTAYVFAWDVATDLPNQEHATVYVRLQSTDTLTASNLAASSAFNTDTLGPVISNISIGQTPGSDVVTINYDLADNSGANNNIVMQISSNGGSTWVVPITSLTGDVGAGITAGTGRSATWNAGVDFNNQENSAMRVQIRGTDRYGNVGNFLSSANFAVDTKAPVVSAVSASQVAGTTNVSVNYTLTDNTSAGHSTEFNVSSDGGATWTVATTTRSGDIGAGQTTGSKTFTWDAGTDYSGHDVSNMRVRVRATDYFGHQGTFVSSANFTLDTLAPVISSLSATQALSGTVVTLKYNLDSSATTTLDISADSGATWTVAKTTLAGDVGAGIGAGTNKTVTWNASTDLNNEEKSTMRFRVRGTDNYNNTSIYYESTDFSVDTAGPLGLTALTKFSSTDTTVTMNWQSSTDAHFNYYELWHGAIENDVTGRTGTATKWSTTDDTALNNPLTISTVITALNITGDYFVKIWAVDDYGNEVTVADVNVYVAPTPVVTPTVTPSTGGGGGGGAPAVSLIPPNKPVLTPLITPTKNTRITISGLADPRSRVDLYDNNNLVGRLVSVADNNGRFSQDFTFNAGAHVLTVKAVDFSNNTSIPSDPVNLFITSGILSAPIILSPSNNESVTETTPTLVGVATPLAQVEITLDNRNKFIAQTNIDGAWQFRLPSSFALRNGTHTFTARTIDTAGNISGSTSLALNKISAVTPIVPTPGVPGVTPTTPGTVPTVPGAPVVIAPVPPASLIRENTEAVELPGIPVPKVTNINTVVANDTFSFTGTALPNQDVIVYIHSDQALIYRTRTDNKGIWNVNHSQITTELTPGDHTIYAVAVDPAAKVKSRPSAVAMFTVERNFWVMMFNYLNLQTTIITLGILGFVILWLYRIRKKELATA